MLWLCAVCLFAWVLALLLQSGVLLHTVPICIPQRFSAFATSFVFPSPKRWPRRLQLAVPALPALLLAVAAFAVGLVQQLANYYAASGIGDLSVVLLLALAYGALLLSVAVVLGGRRLDATAPEMLGRLHRAQL